MIFYQDCHMVIDEAMRIGKMCVGYVNPKGWILYNPVKPLQELLIQGEKFRVEPEILCIHRSIVPIPLGDSSMEIVMSWLDRLNIKFLGLQGCKPLKSLTF